MCAAATTAIGLSRSSQGAVALDLQLVGTGADRSLHVGANASGLDAGAVLRARVTAIASRSPVMASRRARSGSLTDGVQPWNESTTADGEAIAAQGWQQSCQPHARTRTDGAELARTIGTR